MEPPGKRQKGHRPAYSYSNGDSNRRDSNASPRPTTKAFGSGRREEEPSPRPTSWSPRETPFQGPRGVKLSFNYWISHEASHQVLTSEVRKLVMANLVGEPVPNFAEENPKARKVVIACVTGLGMMAADACMTAGACPFLRSCSSIPVRHSLEPNRGGFPRATDVQPSAALMLWDEKPTVPQHEIAAMSMTKLFNECEVTFTGIKSPGWKDDVSFLLSDQPPRSAGTNDPSRSPRGDAAEANSRGDSADDSQDESVETHAVCCGSFWRNLNHDRGHFTLGVEEDDGMAGTLTWVLRLHWDRWDTEIVYLQEGGGPMRFEDKDQTLSLRLACARRLTDLGKRTHRQQEPGPSTSASSSPPASLDATTADAPSRPSSLPDAVASAPSESPGCAETAAASGTQSSDCLDGRAPEEEGRGVTVEIKTPAESLVRIPLESLDPDEFCLKAVDCYRLNIPVRVSAEGPGYVSTDEPMPPPRPRRKDHGGDGGDGRAARRAGSDTGSARREHGMSMARDKSGGESTLDDVGLEEDDEVREGKRRRQRQGSPSSSWRNRMDHDHADESNSNEGEDSEEAARENGQEAERDGKENEEGAIADAVVSMAVDAPRREEGATGVFGASKGRERYRLPEATEGDRKGAEDEETVGTAVGRVVESPHASTSGLLNGGTLDEAEANPDESEEGEIVMPAPQRSSLKRPSTPPPPPPPISSWPEDEEKSCGLQSSWPSRALVPPSADRLCPIPSGPRKGAVILGLDCEMVYTRAGLELARATLVNVKGQIVYDELVQPTGQVTDFNTQFSGITYEMLKGVTRTLRDAQAEILAFVGTETYLVGHSLESDLRALKIVHRRLIDTSELYPSARGAPFKNGLRLLSQTVLGREIQASGDGHDSREDALASLELALLKIFRGPSFGLPPVWAAKMNPPKESIFELLERRELEPFSCKVCGDLEAKASAEHPPRTPVWSVFNSGYRPEQDAVWAARRFGEKSTPSHQGKASSGGTPSDTVAKVTVDAADFPTAGGMFRNALESLQEKEPSLLWLDMPCDCNDFDRGEEAAAAAMWASEMRRETAETNGDHGPSNGRHWKSLVEVDGAMARVYDTMAEGTLLVVLCQGAVSRVVSLLARKTKTKWNAGKLEKKDYIAGQKRAHSRISTFDRQDEEDLASATNDCLDGMCFLAVK